MQPIFPKLFSDLIRPQKRGEIGGWRALQGKKSFKWAMAAG